MSSELPINQLSTLLVREDCVWCATIFLKDNKGILLLILNKRNKLFALLHPNEWLIARSADFFKSQALQLSWQFSYVCGWSRNLSSYKHLRTGISVPRESEKAGISDSWEREKRWDDERIPYFYFFVNDGLFCVKYVIFLHIQDHKPLLLQIQMTRIWHWIQCYLLFCRTKQNSSVVIALRGLSRSIIAPASCCRSNLYLRPVKWKTQTFHCFSLSWLQVYAIVSTHHSV